MARMAACMLCLLLVLLLLGLELWLLPVACYATVSLEGGLLWRGGFPAAVQAVACRLLGLLTSPVPLKSRRYIFIVQFVATSSLHRYWQC
jgi:hypothetical protein